MINVSYLPEQHFLYLPLNNGEPVWPATAYVGPVPGTPLQMNEILLVIPPSSDPVVPISESVRFGWIHEEDDRWGFLGDHSVQHLGGHGNIWIESSALPSRPNPNGLIGGRITTFNASEHLIGNQVVWGEDFFEMGENTLIPYVDAWGREIVFPQPRQFSRRMTFYGDYAIFECSEGPIVVQRSDGVQTASQFAARCWFFHLERGGEIPVLRVSACQTAQYTDGPSQDRAGWFYFFPNQAVRTGQVVADPDTGNSYGIDLVTDADLLRFENDTGPDGAPYQAKRVIDMLKGGQMTALVAQNFAQNPCVYDVGELGEDILKSWKYVDANVLLSLFDLTLLEGEISSWKNLRNNADILLHKARLKSQLPFLKQLKNARKGARMSSNAFLGGKYGMLPTCSDFVRVVDGFKALQLEGNHHQRLHSRHTTYEEGFLHAPIVTSNTLTVEVDSVPKNMRGIQDRLRWGILPNVESVWDYIPYSFVVDWFVRLSDTFHRVDETLYRDYFPIQYSIIGQKRVWDPLLSKLLPDIRATGSVQFTYYSRQCSPDFPLPPYEVSMGSGPGKHWLEATALVVQRVV